MDVDLEFILVVGVVLTGAIWLLDSFALAPARRKRVPEQTRPAQTSLAAKYQSEVAYKEPWYVEYSKSFFPVLLIVLLLRSFIAEPFRIPSGSMMPTLLIGDFILVNKFAYGLRLPVLNSKILDIDSPSRGDVAVFRFPGKPSEDYIKRIVGLPGDHIAYRNKRLYINGEQMEQTPMRHFQGVGSGVVMNGARVKSEALDGVTHQILIREGRLNVEGEYHVPPNHYFVLGDNRDNSNDSRFWGFVPEEYLVGRAFMIWLNWDIKGGVFDFNRIGTKII